MKKYHSKISDNFIGLGVGIGAGSKYLQSLLDSHPDIYMIPGYSLMYFYPHFFENVRKFDKRKNFISLMLDRLPIYDSSLMPGSESLNKLGKQRNKSLIVDKNIFIKETLFYLVNQTINSRNLLLAFHRAHYKIFGHRFRTKNFTLRPFYHIHDEIYLKYFLSDFPNAKFITTTRKPSVNISRRIKSSYLDANKDKLDYLDFKVLELTCIDKMAYYHLKSFVNYKKLGIQPIFINYDNLVKDKVKTILNLCDTLEITKIDKNNIVSSFSGLEYNLDFYERHRNKSIDEIRINALKLAKLENSNLDQLYNSLTLNIKLSNRIIFKTFFEVIKITTYEKDFLRHTYSVKHFYEIIKNLYKVYVDSDIKLYNLFHGYYRYKWSVPNRFIFATQFLKKFLYNPRLKKYSILKNFYKILIILFYFITVLILFIYLPMTIIKRITYQVRLILFTVKTKYKFQN